MTNSALGATGRFHSRTAGEEGATKLEWEANCAVCSLIRHPFHYFYSSIERIAATKSTAPV